MASFKSTGGLPIFERSNNSSAGYPDLLRIKSEALFHPQQIVRLTTQIIRMPPAPTDRDDLTARILPHMILSDGTPSSLTGPPVPAPNHLSGEERAKLRFCCQRKCYSDRGRWDPRSSRIASIARARALRNNDL